MLFVHVLDVLSTLGFRVQHTDEKMYSLKLHCKSLWIKASAKCINVNVGSKNNHKGTNVYTLGMHIY